ncbi:MAG TPA: GAF domain-containing SpoIIE family protein phosphatase [Gemmatimonadales bacterium]|nr:GAF domain-containing SpoIIE family protein phosphatase [Gemmatimonadales bacterium]
MPDVAGGVTRLERMLPALEAASGAVLRVWRQEGRHLRPLVGSAPGWVPRLNGTEPQGSMVETPDGPAWFATVPETEGVWLEVRGQYSSDLRSGERQALTTVVGAVLQAEREAAQVAAELSERYEEIDLIYTISEILGHTIRLEEAAQRIVTEVSTVVRAQRATLLVLDPERRILRLVAARGVNFKDLEPIEIDDRFSVAARVFREGRIVAYDPSDGAADNPGRSEGRGYKGKAFLSVPVLYAAPGRPSKPIGVINLTDRLGEDSFTAGDRKLVAAIANQIGAAIENARLVERDRGQQGMRRELELARDLQHKLLPSPLVISARADVAARCRQAESVGGDFYNLLNLPRERVGVMIGDVTSHGFGAALIMALVMAASGIHAETGESPSEALEQLERSLAEELTRTEMFLTLFYAVIDPHAGRLTYANAGHAHAFVVDGKTGVATRLEATRTPLGMAATPGRDEMRIWQHRRDVLCLFTDGIVDAKSESGERFGEERALAHVRSLAERPVREMLEAIFTEVVAFTGGGKASDDRTMVLLRT